MLAHPLVKPYITIKQFDHQFNNQVTRIFKENLALGSETSIISSKGAILGRYTRKDSFDSIHVKCISGFFENVAVNLELEIDEWQPDNYICMPGVAYNGNRFESRKIPYSPKLTDEKDIGPEIPTIIADIPRLTKEEGFSRIQLKSGVLTMPCVGIFFHELKKMLWIQTLNRSNNLETGISIEESRDKSRLRIHISIPGVRELARYKITNCSYPVDDRGMELKTGDEIEIPIKVHVQESNSFHDFYSFYFTLRNNFSNNDINRSFSLSSCFEVIEKKYNKHNWVNDPGYYSVGMRNGRYRFLQDWQLGWTGGMISTLPLLQEGKDQSVKRSLAHFKWFFNAPLCPAGLFWDSGEQGNKWYGGDIRRKHTSNWHLTRKSADAVYYLLKQFIRFEQTGITVPREWKRKTKSVIDTLIAIWAKYQQLGQFIHSETGEVEVGGSTSAAILPAGLLMAADYYNEKTYAEHAVKIAEQLYKTFLSNGMTSGGPGDALQAADSESAYGLLASMVDVYCYTKDKRWLKKAIVVANYFSSWVMSYNFQFPENSPLGKLNVTTRGSVFANTQNTHGAPGICTYSGIALLKLFRNTKDVRYLNLLQEITRNIPQYLSHPCRPIPAMEEGFVSERINTSDWLEGTGELMYGSTWSEVSLMLTFAEIPGVYIVPDMKLAVAFDQVECETSFYNGKFHVNITNNSKTDARIYLFYENSGSFTVGFTNEYFTKNRISIDLKINEKNTLTY